MSANTAIFALGFLAQGLFSARMLVQWIMSEKAGKVVNPTIYWALSLVASYIFFIYGWLREDFALMLGQVLNYFIYIWNLEKKEIRKTVPRPLSIFALSLLLATPVLCITALLATVPCSELSARLFDNADIPIWLLATGSTGQAILSLRFLYQLIYSARRGESMLPLGFWVISLTGASITIVYGIFRLDPVILVGQACGFAAYSRQIALWRKSYARS